MSELTREQVRDELAKVLGWDKHVGPKGDVLWCTPDPTCKGGKPVHYQEGHPIPDTLDGIAALTPKGWVIEINIMDAPHGVTAMATWPQPYTSHLTQAHTELESRERLLLQVLTHERRKEE